MIRRAAHGISIPRLQHDLIRLPTSSPRWILCYSTSAPQENEGHSAAAGVGGIGQFQVQGDLQKVGDLWNHDVKQIIPGNGVDEARGSEFTVSPISQADSKPWPPPIDLETASKLLYLPELVDGNLKTSNHSRAWMRKSSHRQLEELEVFLAEKGHFVVQRPLDMPHGSHLTKTAHIMFKFGEICVKAIGQGTNMANARQAAHHSIIASLLKDGNFDALLKAKSHSLPELPEEHIKSLCVPDDLGQGHSKKVSISGGRLPMLSEFIERFAIAGLIPESGLFTHTHVSKRTTQLFIHKLEIKERGIFIALGDMAYNKLENCVASHLEKLFHERGKGLSLKPLVDCDISSKHDISFWLAESVDRYRHLYPKSEIAVVSCKQGPFYKAYVTLSDKMIGGPAFSLGYTDVQTKAYTTAAAYLLKESHLLRESYKKWPNFNQFVKDLKKAMIVANLSPNANSNPGISQKNMQKKEPMKVGIGVLEVAAKDLSTKNQDQAMIVLQAGEQSLSFMENILSISKKEGIDESLDRQFLEVTSKDFKNMHRRGMTNHYLRSMRSNALLDHLTHFNSLPSLASLRTLKSSLPMRQNASEIVELVNGNTYSIIVGATGSGKTTQVPQMIFEDAIRAGNGGHCNIICTQPRRIAAKSVAARVAYERNESVGEHVGYHVRYENKYSNGGRVGSIMFQTTGILLEQLRNDADGVLQDTSHLVIDEVHERDVNIDYLLSILKTAVKDRIARNLSIPHIVLMSATLEATLFSDYFRDHDIPSIKPPPMISVPGRTFPVRERFLEEILDTLAFPTKRTNFIRILARETSTRQFLNVEEAFSGAKLSEILEPELQARLDEPMMQWSDNMVHMDWASEIASQDKTENDEIEEDVRTKVPPIPLKLVVATVEHICKTTNDGAILVFLPGLGAIEDVHDELRTVLRDSSKYWIIPLHSSLQDSQRKVFEPIPRGIRKIILSTNIAETSITLPDVQHVVDSGKSRQTMFHQLEGTTQLKSDWISKSSSKQRAGRAGRVQNGNYWALFTKARYDSFPRNNVPEVLRSDLQSICMDIKARKPDRPIKEFLGSLIEPPLDTSVAGAIVDLVDLGALTSSEQITPLGMIVSKLPMSPRYAKLIILGIIYRCLDPMIIIAASAEERNLFRNHLQVASEIEQEFSMDTKSDQIAGLNAFSFLRYLKHVGHADTSIFTHYHQISDLAYDLVERHGFHIQSTLEQNGLIPGTGYQSKTYDMNEGCHFGNAHLNKNSDNDELIKALLTSAFSSNLAITKAKKQAWFSISGERKALLDEGPLNWERKSDRGKTHRIITAAELVRRADGDHSLALRDTTEVSPLVAALFGSPGSGGLELYGDKGIAVQGWLKIACTQDELQKVSAVSKVLRILENSSFHTLAMKQPVDASLTRVTDLVAEMLGSPDVLHPRDSLLDGKALSSDNAGKAASDTAKSSQSRFERVRQMVNRSSTFIMVPELNALAYNKS